MAKYYRMNPYLGCKYEISEHEALKKIKSRNWMPVWDEYWQRPREDAWFNIKDQERDWILKEESGIE